MSLTYVAVLKQAPDFHIHLTLCVDDETWLSARRDERLTEFAPPQIYTTTDSAPPPHRHHMLAPRSQKRLYASKPHQQQYINSATSTTSCSTVADGVTAMLQSIQSSIEQSDRTVPVSTAANIIFAEVYSPSVDVTLPPSADGFVEHFAGGSFSVNFDSQIMPSSSTYSQLFLDQSLSAGIVSETLPSPSSTAFDASSAASVAFSEDGIMTESFGVSSNSLAPQPAHYSAAPSRPQPKMPKYERVFLHDLPPTLPLPPMVGSSSAQYPSQEEIIGPKRRKESHESNEKDSILSWYRQFDQKQTKLPVVLQTSEVSSEDAETKNQLLKPKNIPFASPYIQTNDASSKVVDDPAAKEFDPTIPPPSTAANST